MRSGKRVSFLINSMEGGGAERAMANLLNHLLPHLGGYEVELILLDDLPNKQSLPPDLKVVKLDGRGSLIRSAFCLWRYWSKSGGRPELCLSFLARANVLNVVFGKLYGFRKIISERVHTSSHIAGSVTRPLVAWLTRATYPRADSVIAVGQGVADDLHENFAVPNALLSVIGNPIDGDRLLAMSKDQPSVDLPDDFFVGVGRFVPNKNFGLFLDAFKLANPKCSVVLLGQGPEEEHLRAKAIELGIQDKVHFAGYVENPYPIMARARALVSCSRAEGFPNTLIEAMTVGCPIIATDCPSGPATVLNSPPSKKPPWPDTAHGILVPMEDVSAMAAAIQAMCDSEIRDMYAARAAKRARDYGHVAVTNAYLKLINSMT